MRQGMTFLRERPIRFDHQLVEQSMSIRTNSPAPFFPAAACAAALALAPALHAQERSVTWTSTTQLEVAGDLGALFGAFPSGIDSRRSEHGLHLTRRTLRQDEGSASSIVDLDERRLITIDHEARLYMTMDLDRSLALVRQMAAQAEGGEGEEGGEWRLALEEELRAGLEETRGAVLEEVRAATDEISEELDFELDVRSTGETRAFGGYSSSRHLVTVQIGVGEGLGGMVDAGPGRIAFVADLWQSTDFPSADRLLAAWVREMARELDFEGFADEIPGLALPTAKAPDAAALALWDPRVADGLGRLSDVLTEIEGTALRTVTSVAFVPDGVPMDPEAILAWESAGLGERARQAAAEGARDAARGALRSLTRGALGRDREPEPELEEAPEATWRPLFRLITEITDIRDRNVPDPDLFRIPADYGERQVSRPAPGG